MRDAFGGAFMIRIFMIFILIYILLTALALNYAKAYRAKELIIAYLEDNEIYKISDMSAEEQEAMEGYFESVLVGKLGYVVPMVQESCPQEETREIYCFSPGITIERFEKPTDDANKLGVYYKVTTYYRYNIGFLRVIKAANNSEVDHQNDFDKWTISGETRPIVRD